MQERRNHTRIDKECRIEYGPFSAMLRPGALRSGALRNIGSGGVLFTADAACAIGEQLFLKIYIPGWQECDGRCHQVTGSGSELLLETVAEVLRVDDTGQGYLTGVRFLGSVQQSH